MENRFQKCTRSLRTNWTIKLKGRKNILAPKISSTDRETSKNNVKICPSNLKILNRFVKLRMSYQIRCHLMILHSVGVATENERNSLSCSIFQLIKMDL